MALPVSLLGLATAVPPHVLEQTAVAEFARHIYAAPFARFPKLADVFVNAGIERRYSVRSIEWFAAPRDWRERTEAYLEGAGGCRALPWPVRWPMPRSWRCASGSRTGHWPGRRKGPRLVRRLPMRTRDVS